MKCAVGVNCFGEQIGEAAVRRRRTGQNRFFSGLFGRPQCLSLSVVFVGNFAEPSVELFSKAAAATASEAAA